MPHEPLISVVVPVYQAERWLCRCVDSLLAQTYAATDIILVDDGSPDSCGALCDKYAVQESRIRVIHQKNRGLSAARNAGTAAAKGEYITFVDSDDWVEPDLIERLWYALDQEKADVAVCGYRIEPGGRTQGRMDGTYKVFDAEQALEALCYQKCMETSAWAKLYRTEAAKRFLYPEGRLFEDIATTYKFLANARRVVICDQALYHYWQHPESIMARPFHENRFDTLISVDEMYRFISVRYPKLERAATCRRFSCYCQVLLAMPEQGYEAERKQIWGLLKTTRKSVLWNPKARIKNRIAALLCYGGEGTLRSVWKKKAQKGKKNGDDLGFDGGIPTKP